MGTRTKTRSKKSGTAKIPHKERFGNKTAAPNRYQKQHAERTHRPTSFRNRELGSR